MQMIRYQARINAHRFAFDLFIVLLKNVKKRYIAEIREIVDGNVINFTLRVVKS